MPEKKFQRNIENFTCSECGREVEGTGYTDHCPDCLWSRHVDINPGDRKAKCDGAMEPIGVTVKKGGKYRIRYKCTKCGIQRWQYAAADDKVEKLIELSSNPII